MALINKQPYITPEMIAAWNSGGSLTSETFLPAQTYRDPEGALYFSVEKMAGMVTLHFPTLKNLTTSGTLYEVGQLPSGYRPHVAFNTYYTTDSTHYYYINIEPDGKIKVMPRQAETGRVFVNGTFSFISG